jgi:hypothetical protein
MPIALQFNPENKILYATIIDAASSDGFSDTLNKIAGSNDYPPDIGILLDTSSICTSIGNAQFKLDLNDIRKIFPEKGNTRIAIIAASDYTFGTKRLHEMLSDNWPQNIRVFSDFIEGEEWLEGFKKQ